MALNPPPIIDNHLVLVTQRLSRPDTSQIAEVTYAVIDSLAAGAQTCADLFQVVWNTDMASVFDTDVTSEKASVLYGTGTTTSEVAIASGATTVGTNTNKVLPSNVAVLVKKSTLFAGRANRGRTFLPWVAAESQVSETGIIDPTQVTAYTTAFEAFKADLAINNISMVLANKVLVVTPPQVKPHVSAIHQGHLVTDYICQPMVATQRRRLGR